MLKKLSVFFFVIAASAPLSGSWSWQTTNKRFLGAAGLLGASLMQKNSSEVKYMAIYGGLLQAFGKIAPAYKQSTNEFFDFSASLYASYKIINALNLMPATTKNESTEKKLNDKNAFFEPSLVPPFLRSRIR